MLHTIHYIQNILVKLVLHDYININIHLYVCVYIFFTTHFILQHRIQT